MYKHLFAAVLMIAVSSSQAQVRVVESSPQGTRPGVGQSLPSAVGVQTDVLSEIQALKFEIANLRGMVEEQAHLLSRLQQQQNDNYLDLDKRVSVLSGRSGSSAVSQPQSSTLAAQVSPERTTIAPVAAGAGDAEVYAAAYDLLRQRQYDAAVVGLKDYLTRFPTGAYAGNSYYWLGEIYLLKEDLPHARDWFSRLLTDFPQDRKVADTQFKLGKVYHLLGDNDRAQALLNQVSAGTSDAARLAKQYLQENF